MNTPKNTDKTSQGYTLTPKEQNFIEALKALYKAEELALDAIVEVYGEGFEPGEGQDVFQSDRFGFLFTKLSENLKREITTLIEDRVRGNYLLTDRPEK
jgi:hypothetical protein